MIQSLSAHHPIEAVNPEDQKALKTCRLHFRSELKYSIKKSAKTVPNILEKPLSSSFISILLLLNQGASFSVVSASMLYKIVY